ncbi:MAG: ABC transporter substrate-binding protein [Nitrososphaerota archaeon]|nr:ABC transporter substrate-binding protein [Nitrososphaerota archaeon]
MKTRRNGVSTAAVAALFIIGLIIGAGAVYGLGVSSSAPSTVTSTVTSTVAGAGATQTQTIVSTVTGTAASGLSGTITIGDLVALTGDLSAYGQRSKDAVDMAIADINAWLATTGSPVRFAVDHEDTATDPNTALQKLQLMASKGIQAYVGPMTSAEARNVLSYANNNHLVLISQSSTAEDLKIANDYLFRLVPSDYAQAAAAAKMMQALGIKDAIFISRSDTWGVGLSSATIADFKAIGGTEVDQIQYQVSSSGSYDFSSQLATLNTDYTNAVKQYGAANVGIMAVSFDELATMYQQASSYPSLLSSTWFGTDGTAESSTVTGTSGQTAAQVKSLSTIYAPTLSSKEQNFTNAFVAKYNQHPDAYSYSAYDATWVAALSIIACGANSGACIQKTLPGVAAGYFGVAGWPDLDYGGDRAIADYAIWEVGPCSSAPAGSCTAGQTYTWNQVGTWNSGSNSVTFTQTP